MNFSNLIRNFSKVLLLRKVKSSKKSVMFLYIYRKDQKAGFNV